MTVSASVAQRPYEPPAELSRSEMIALSDRVLALPDIEVRRSEDVLRIVAAGLDWDIGAVVYEPADASRIPTGPDGK